MFTELQLRYQTGKEDKFVLRSANAHSTIISHPGNQGDQDVLLTGNGLKIMKELCYSEHALLMTPDEKEKVYNTFAVIRS